MLNLESLFEPLTLEQFATDYWGRKQYFSSKKNQNLSELLSWDMIKEYLKDPQFYSKTKILLRSDSFTDSIQPTSLSEVQKGIDDGFTLQIRYLQYALPTESPLMQLATKMQGLLLQPLDSITFFYSIPSSLPTAIHKDIPEIFSIQIAGKKKWQIADEKCLTEQMSFVPGEITHWNDYVLSAGNFMYSPSYFPHQVQCVDEPSLSVALIFSNIQMGNIMSYLSDDPHIKECMLQPMPILSDARYQNTALARVNECLEVIKRKMSSFDTELFLNSMRTQLSEYK